MKTAGTTSPTWAGGLRTRFSRPAGPGEVELGGELFGERYEQDNFETLDDGSAGDPIGSHDEDRWYYFSYLGWRLTELERVQLEAALTVRQTGYDRLRDDGTEDQRTFAPVVLPRVALGYRFGSGVQLFGVLSRGISVPGADNVLFLPEVETGDLAPETGWNREVGMRGSHQLGKQLLTYEVTVFRTSIRNALVSRQTEQQQPYLLNGGRTRYQGAELFVDWLVLPGRTWLKLTSAYTYIDAFFVDFSTANGDFTGNDLPGVPPHRFLAWLTLGRGGFTARLGVDAADKMPANDANSEFSEAYQVLHLRLSYNHYFRWLGRSWVLEGRAGAENLTDEQYASMLQVNAAGFGTVPPRFFYPGLPRYGFLGLSLRVEW